MLIVVVRTDPYPQKIPTWLYGHVFLLIGKQGFIGQNLSKATMDLLFAATVLGMPQYTRR